MLPKTCLAMHDMVTIGRCSLTVVIPVLSAMGVKVCPLPTALLSSDTGGFGPVYSLEQTQAVEGILRKLEGLDARFDACYSGYLGLPAQALIVEEVMQSQKGLTVVDPVMGDMGELYKSVAPEMVGAMRRLCSKAGLITPNLTEAMLLLGRPMPKEPICASAAAEILDGLLSLGCKAAVVTGVRMEEGGLATLLGDEKGRMALIGPRLEAHFPGTGDLFSSILTGELLRGMGLPAALEAAVGFVHRAMRYTLEENAPPREGVLLEPLLFELASGQYARPDLCWRTL